MIKFIQIDDDQTEILVGFGFSEGNIIRLKKGQPVKISLTEMGIETPIPIEILIFYGKTEQEMVDQLQHAIGVDTQITVDDKLV